MSSDDLTTALGSGSILRELASEKSVSSTDLLSSVEKDLQAKAPQGAPSLSEGQVSQIASDIISGRGPHGASEKANSNLTALAGKVGMDPSVLLSQLMSGASRGELPNKSGGTGYGSGAADSISGGVALDEYA